MTPTRTATRRARPRRHGSPRRRLRFHGPQAGLARWLRDLDDCALTILATVVSHARPDRYILDGGLKTFAGENYEWGTYGRILDRPDIVVTRATEEHGIVILPPDVPDPGWKIGDRVRVR